MVGEPEGGADGAGDARAREPRGDADYTHVSIRKLQEVHAAPHPRAELGSKVRQADEEAREGGEARLDALVALLEDDDVGDEEARP